MEPPPRLPGAGRAFARSFGCADVPKPPPSNSMLSGWFVSPPAAASQDGNNVSDVAVKILRCSTKKQFDDASKEV